MQKKFHTPLPMLRALLNEIKAFCPMLDDKTIAQCCELTISHYRALLTDDHYKADRLTQYSIQQFHSYCLLFHTEWQGLSAVSVTARWYQFNTNKTVRRAAITRIKRAVEQHNAVQKQPSNKEAQHG